MKTLKILLGSLLISFFIFTFTFANYDINSVTSSNGYNSPIFDGTIKFNAILKDSKVYTSWTKYNKDEKFKYYKVIRSVKVSNPIYPENGYIKYSRDINFLEYIDYKPSVGVNYYRVCAITEEKKRYCSNVVKVIVGKDNSEIKVCTMEYAPVCGEKNGVKKTYSNKCLLEFAGAKKLYFGKCETVLIIGGDRDEHGCIGSAGYKWCAVKNKCIRPWEEKCEISTISEKLKLRIDIVIEKFISKIELKHSNNNKRIYIIKTVINKLDILAIKKPKIKNLVNYINGKFQEKIDFYADDFSSIENILNEY